MRAKHTFRNPSVDRVGDIGVEFATRKTLLIARQIPTGKLTIAQLAHVAQPIVAHSHFGIPSPVSGGSVLPVIPARRT